MHDELAVGVLIGVGVYSFVLLAVFLKVIDFLKRDEDRVIREKKKERAIALRDEMGYVDKTFGSDL